MESNKLLKSLSKTLKTEIKYMIKVEMKSLNSLNKDTESNGNESVIPIRKKVICLGVDKIIILNETMEKKFDVIPYELLNYIEIDKKHKQSFFIFIKPNTIMKNSTTVKFNIRTESRGTLVKSIMCYYSVYFMYHFSIIKSLTIVRERVGENELKKEEEIFTRLKNRTLKSYVFYFYGFIQTEFNNSNFRIKYDMGKDERKPKVEDKHTNECDILVEIFDPTPMGKFDSQKDEKDLSFYAYSYFLSYMRNTLKVNKFWITKSKIYFKKFNLAEDDCQWEGWWIEAMTSDPFYKNLIFVFLRRKFLPPFYENYQNFLFVLSEDCSKENYEINPAAYKLMEIMTGSLHSTISSCSTRESDLFLKAKVDSLIVDEETLFYYQFSHKIIGDDVHKFGFDLLNSILEYFEITMKDKIGPYKNSLITKFKEYEFDEKLEKWKFQNKSFKFLEKINDFINDTIGLKSLSVENNILINNKTTEYKSVSKESGLTVEENTETNLGFSYQNSFTIKNNICGDKLTKIKTNWRVKVMRFISYCLNGGLTDFTMTYEKFISIFNKNQSANNDIQELIFLTINIVDLDKPEGKLTKENIYALSEKSKLIFNEEALAVTIKTGFLQKVFAEISVSTFPKFMNIILSNYCSNKILMALLEYLKAANELAGEDMFISDERKELIRIIPPLVKIFTDRRKCPTTLILSCKCLCFLSLKKSDEVIRKKIVFEGNIVSTIALYLELFDFDEKLILCCLDLLGFVMNEPEINILENLYGNGDRLFERIKKFLEPTGVPGVYYSQRIIIKALTIFLNLTNKIEAEVKPRINSQYKIFYDLLIGAIDDEKKMKVIDPKEEMSYILEFKTYWLLCILTFKNPIAREYLNSMGIKEFIEEKSKKFIKLIQMINVNKQKGLSESKITAISKNISKFFEFVYYLLINEKEEVIQFKKDSVSFMALRKKIEDHRSLLILHEKESCVFDWIEKIFRLTDEEYI